MTDLKMFEKYFDSQNRFHRVIDDPDVMEQPTPELERATAHIKFEISVPPDNVYPCFDETGHYMGKIQDGRFYPGTVESDYPEVAKPS